MSRSWHTESKSMRCYSSGPRGERLFINLTEDTLPNESDRELM